MRPLPMILAFAVLLLASCAKEGPTLTIELRSDLVAGIEITAVRTTVEGPGATRSAEYTVARGVDLPGGLRVADMVLDKSGDWTARLELLNPLREVVGTRRVAFDVSTDTGFTVVFTRNCVPVVCPGSSGSAGDTECLDAQCVPPECTEENRELCGGWVGCGSDGDCPEPSATCAVARCLQGVCLDLEQPGSCDVSAYCDPEIGCVGPSAMSDAGVEDAMDDVVTDASDDVSPDVMTVECGNRSIDDGEECDGPRLGDATCMSRGFLGGSLACLMCRFDERGCNFCGDGIIDAGDVCDGADLGGATCDSVGFSEGTLACAADCAYDTSGCVGEGLTRPTGLGSFGPITPSGRVGAATGTLLVSDCPEGKVLVGLDGRFTSEGITQFRAVCSPISLSGDVISEDAPGTVTTGLLETLEVQGLSTGASFSHRCPENQVIVGVLGHGNLELIALQFKCAPLEARLLRSNYELVATDVTYVERSGATDLEREREADCPSGQIARGFQGHLWLGEVISGYLRCQAVGLANTLRVESTEDTAMVGATDGAPELDACPPGSVLTGFDGQSDARVANIRGRCARVEVVGRDTEEATVAFFGATATSLRGRDVGTDWEAACPPGAVVVGFEGAAGDELESLRVRCGMLGVSLGALQVTDIMFLPAVGSMSGAAFDPISCPANQIATTMKTWSASAIDGFGLGCSALSF